MPGRSRRSTWRPSCTATRPAASAIPSCLEAAANAAQTPSWRLAAVVGGASSAGMAATRASAGSQSAAPAIRLPMAKAPQPRASMATTAWRGKLGTRS